MTEPTPSFTGRFNIFRFRPDSWNVIFAPYGSPTCMIIAKNLFQDEALDLMRRLNATIRDTEDEILDTPESPKRDTGASADTP